MAEHSLAVEASGLVKRFGKVTAVDGIDLAVAPGTVYGVLGPNGAGKTTTTRILATLLHPDAGTAKVFGHDVVRESAAVRDRVSLTGQFAAVDDQLTGLENLIVVARLLGFRGHAAKTRAEELLAAFDLTEAAGRLVGTYSGGMQRRIDVAASLVLTPDLLFLDEPTTGLDPQSRHQVWRIIRTLVDGGTTVLLTTQYLDEADRLSDRVAVIDSGKVIAEGTPAELKAATGTATIRLTVADAGRVTEARQVLGEHVDGTSVDAADNGTRTLSGRTSAPGRVTDALAELSRRDIAVTDFTFGPPSLDEVFLALTGHTTAGDAGAEEDVA
ncbi:ATP-binding cassette domain-containing protein [Amycolatopsis sp. NPDC005003]